MLEPSGGFVAIDVSSANGVDVEALGFLYTPALDALVSGDTVSGGDLLLNGITDPAAGAGQVLWLRLDDPFQPLVDLTLPAQVLGPITLSFGPLDPVLAGFPLEVQAVVSGEGGEVGAFTNVAGFVIP